MRKKFYKIWWGESTGGRIFYVKGGGIVGKISKFLTGGGRDFPPIPHSSGNTGD